MKTAIIIRGHPRTWNYVHDYNIKTFANIYLDADWFVVMPKSDTVTERSIRENLASVNLVSLNIVDEGNYPPSFWPHSGNRYFYYHQHTVSYWKPAWFDYMANLDKREYELNNNIRYDNVLTIRPDVYYHVTDVDIPELRITLDPMAVSNMNYADTKLFDHWSTSDMNWRAGSLAADIFGMRFIDTHFTDNIPGQLKFIDEMFLPGYYQARNLINGTRHVGSIRNFIIRPTCIEYIPDLQMAEIDKSISIWNTGTSKADKIKLCDNFNIDIRDYQLTRN